MLTCSTTPGGLSMGRRPACPRALFSGMANASLVAVGLWLLILNGLGVI